MTGDKGKRILIHLSSSDDSDFSDDEINVASSSSGDDCELIDDYDGVNGGDFGSSEDDSGGDNGDDADEYVNRDEDDGDDQHTVSNQVVHFLQEKRDLQELSLKTCKLYLRRNGLRVSGNKDVCVQRVLEHWRIKDGEAELLYPRTSFNINCKGDVCRGDIVLFTQKVYGSFDKVRRNGKHQGKRTIAGRVVKESYGAEKQQHTFTVEVLWSKGVKKLPVLFPLLVKGRNLYRLHTCRQPWKNEEERRKVLAEKHTRGTAARLKREKRKRAWSGVKGSKSQKACHAATPSKMSCSTEQGVSTSKHSIINRKKYKNTRQQGATIHTTRTKSSKPCVKHQSNPFRKSHTASRIHSKPPGGFHSSSIPLGSASENSRLNFLYLGQMRRPADSSYHNPCYVPCPRMAHENYHFFPPELGSAGQQYGSLRCSIQGCIGPGSNRCVIGACWRCCRREGMRCNIHR